MVNWILQKGGRILVAVLIRHVFIVRSCISDYTLDNHKSILMALQIVAVYLPPFVAIFCDVCLDCVYTGGMIIMAFSLVLFEFQ